MFVGEIFQYSQWDMKDLPSAGIMLDENRIKLGFKKTIVNISLYRNGSLVFGKRGISASYEEAYDILDAEAYRLGALNGLDRCNRKVYGNV